MSAYVERRGEAQSSFRSCAWHAFIVMPVRGRTKATRKMNYAVNRSSARRASWRYRQVLVRATPARSAQTRPGERQGYPGAV